MKKALLTYNPTKIQNASIGHQPQTHVIHSDKRYKRGKTRNSKLRESLKGW
jgi:hypothetical protein